MVRRLNRVRGELQRTRARDMLIIGLDTIAQVKRRVINTGINHEGRSFGVYSQAYQRTRKKENLTARPFPNVNFKRTTRMWNNTTAQVIGKNQYAVTIRLAPTQSGEQEKLKHNEDRFGTIIDLDPKERKRLERAIRRRYTRTLINNNII